LIASFSSSNAETIGFSAGAFSQTGSTFSTPTKTSDSGTSAGDNVRPCIYVGNITAATGAAGAITFTMTGASSTANAPAGSTIVLVIRQSSLAYFEWLPNEVTQPSDYSTVTDGQQIWINPNAAPLRTSMHYNGAGYGVTTHNGYPVFKSYINPRTPDPGVGLFNYRNEIEKWPIRPAYKIGTRELFGTIYSTTTDLNLNRPTGSGEIVVMQDHAGSYAPYTTNSPIIYCGLAYTGQNGGVQNQFRIVNKAVDFVSPGSGQVLTSFVFEPNKRYAIVFDITYDTINGKLKVYMADVTSDPNTAYTLVYDRTETTVWRNAADGGSNPGVGGNWKFLVYAQGVRTESGVLAYEALCGGTPGCWTYTMYALMFRNLVLYPGDSLYNTASSTLVNGIMNVKNIL
jgi:hypothetical protein